MNDDLARLNLFSAAGLDAASDDERIQFVEEAVRLIILRALARAYQALPENRREEFENIFNDSTTEEERVYFFTNRVPAFTDILREETLTFKQEALDVAQKLSL